MIFGECIKFSKAICNVAHSIFNPELTPLPYTAFGLNVSQTRIKSPDQMREQLGCVKDTLKRISKSSEMLLKHFLPSHVIQKSIGVAFE